MGEKKNTGRMGREAHEEDALFLFFFFFSCEKEKGKETHSQLSFWWKLYNAVDYILEKEKSNSNRELQPLVRGVNGE